VNWADFLGDGNIATQKVKYKAFEDARDYARGLGLLGKSEWESFRKNNSLPIDIPSTPSRTYKDKGWQGFGDWLGTGNTATHKRNYKSFNDAKDYVNTLGIKNHLEWIKYVKDKKLPKDIPSNPNLVYKNDGWIGYGDWLGTGVISSTNKRFVSFSEAKNFVKKQKIKGQNDWVNFCKQGFRPSDIPSNPQKQYCDEWKGWEDFLGKEK
jgi:hypothetical protein